MSEIFSLTILFSDVLGIILYIVAGLCLLWAPKANNDKREKLHRIIGVACLLFAIGLVGGDLVPYVQFLFP